MSNAFLPPVSDRRSQMRLHGQVQARTTRKTEWNTIHGVAQSINNQQREAIKRRNAAWQNSYSRLLIMQSAIVGSAESELLDFRQTLKGSKYYRQEVKRAINAVDCEFFEKWSKGFLKRDYKNNQSLVLDIMDRSVSTLKPHITKLYWNIKQEMDNENVPDSAIKAKAYECALLMSYACFTHDAHMAIGPFILDYADCLTRERQMCGVIEELRSGKSMAEAVTMEYDYDYACAMKDARPTLLKMQTATIKHCVCGDWTHVKGGAVDQCLTAIRNKITDYGWLDNVSLAGLTDNGEFCEEIALLEKFDIFSRGEVKMTIDLLEAVMWFRNGKTDDEIRAALYAAYEVKELADEQVKNVMNIISLLRLCTENEGGLEYFNQLSNVWTEHGREAAENFHQKTRKVAEAKDKAKDKTPIKYDEKDVMVAMLESKFGKVTKAKEKKKPTPKVATSEPLQLEVQPPTKKRTNNHWSQEEEEFLCSEVEKKIPYTTIGKELHRTESACYQRYLKIQKRPKKPRIGGHVLWRMKN